MSSAYAKCLETAGSRSSDTERSDEDIKRTSLVTLLKYGGNNYLLAKASLRIKCQTICQLPKYCDPSSCQ